MSRTTQAKYLTYGGITDTLVGWSQRTGLKANTIKARLQDHWSVVDALTRPMDQRRSDASRIGRAKFDQRKEFNLPLCKAEAQAIATERIKAAARSAREERDHLHHRAAIISAHRDRHATRLSEPRRLLLLAAELRLLMTVYPNREPEYHPRIRELCRRARKVWKHEQAERRVSVA